MAAGADDAKVLRHQALPVEVKEAGEQLALGQIAGGSEQHQDPVGWTLARGHRGSPGDMPSTYTVAIRWARCPDMTTTFTRG